MPYSFFSDFDFKARDCFDDKTCEITRKIVRHKKIVYLRINLNKIIPFLVSGEFVDDSDFPFKKKSSSCVYKTYHSTASFFRKFKNRFKKPHTKNKIVVNKNYPPTDLSSPIYGNVHSRFFFYRFSILLGRNPCMKIYIFFFFYKK